MTAWPLTGKPGRRGPAAHRQASYRGGESPGESPGPPETLAVQPLPLSGCALARVCESFADWRHGKVQSVATACPDAITMVLRVAGFVCVATASIVKSAAKPCPRYRDPRAAVGVPT